MTLMMVVMMVMVMVIKILAIIDAHDHISKINIESDTLHVVHYNI